MSARGRCTACGSERIGKDPFFYDWKGDRYWIHRCANCTHQFVHPQITPEQQAAMYDAYFSASGDWVCGLFGGASYQDATEALVREASQILRLIPTRTGRLLDIGCAGGVFLSKARKAGFVVQGVELNPGQAESARSTYGLEVLNARIEDAPRELGPFDVVTLLDVLEHVPQPLAAIRRVSGWMDEGGYLLIRGPLSNSRLAHLKEAVRRIVAPVKRLPGYPLDANMFNRRSLTTMLAAAGFTTTNVWELDGFANLLAVRDG